MSRICCKIRTVQGTNHNLIVGRFVADNDKVHVKSTLKASGPSGRSLSWFRSDYFVSPSQGYPRINFAGTYLYTWMERGTVRVQCIA